MQNKSFIIVIDNDANPEIVTQVMRDTVEIEKWWHHLAGTYIIITKLDTNAVAHKIHKLIGNSSCLLTEIDLSRSSGFLPKDAWAWIRRRVSQGQETAVEVT